MLKRRLTGPTAIALAMVLTLAVSGASAQEAINDPAPEPVEFTNPDPEGTDNAEVGQDFGLTADEVDKYMAIVEQAHALKDSLEKDAPAAFGGIYIDWHPFDVTVLVAPSDAAELRSAVARHASADLSSYLQIRETPWTEDRLIAMQAAVETAAQRRLSSLDIDIRTGEVMATGATVSDVAAIKDKINADKSIVSERVDVNQGAPVTDADVSFGGLDMNDAGGNAVCTSGFSVAPDGSGNDGITTAAHCEHHAGMKLRDTDLNFVEDKWGGSYDVEWFHTPGMTDENKIRDNDNGSTRDITGKEQRNDMAVGDPVCHYGRISGYGCGTIASKNFDPGCYGGHCFDSTFIRVNNDYVIGGDSGGPYFHAQKAYGLTKGYTASGDPFFMAQNYMSAMNIHVKVN